MGEVGTDESGEITRVQVAKGFASPTKVLGFISLKGTESSVESLIKIRK